MLDKWLQLFEEASKVLHMDKSHDAIRQALQAVISTDHRAANAGSDSSSYYDTPYVRDVYGSEDSGTVVHSHKGALTASKYSKGKAGYAISDHRPVKQAYVSADSHNKESMTMLLDGKDLVVSESLAAKVELTEVIELQEADAKTATAKITLISAGKGAMGFYTEAALKKAAKDGIFNSGTQMFLNHQTQEERKARPEGDITKLAASLTGKAEYVEGSNGKPGRLVAPAKIYPEFAPFVAARKSDIGVSVRVGVEPSGKTQDGVPVVESMAYALSADFVTKAGRGGKIEELYESYREQNPGTRQPAAGSEAMTDEEKLEFKTLRESNAALTLRVDRVSEQNTQLMAGNLLSESLAASGLSARGQKRIKDSVLANLPLTDKGVLDVAKLQESVKTAVADEKAYLQESGVITAVPIVRHQGGSVIQFIDKDGKDKTENELSQEADKAYDTAMSSILNKEVKTA